MPDGDKDDGSQRNAVLPGAVISPGGSAPQPEVKPEVQAAGSPSEQPVPEMPGPQKVPEASEPAQPAEPQGGFFNPDGAEDVPETVSEPTTNAPESVTWTASEYINHEKSSSWYMGLAVVAAILGFFIYLLTRDFVSVGVVIVGAIAFGYYGGRRPRQLEYQLDHRGLTVGGKRYEFGQFKSYSVVPEGPLTSIVFMPLKRFATALTVYYAPEDEKRVMAVLSGSLPYEDPRRDAVDSLMKKIRF